MHKKINKFFRKFFKSKAFTIIELLVVLSIIAVLATIISVDVAKYIRKSQDVAVKMDMDQLYSMAFDYQQANGDYAGLCNDETTGFIYKLGVITDVNSMIELKCRDGSGDLALGNVGTGGLGTAGLGDDEGGGNPEPAITCESDEWVITASLVSENGKWCVDNTGAKKLITESLTGCFCP